MSVDLLVRVKPPSFLIDLLDLTFYHDGILIFCKYHMYGIFVILSSFLSDRVSYEVGIQYFPILTIHRTWKENDPKSNNILSNRARAVSEIILLLL